MSQNGSVREVVRDFAEADESFRLRAGWFHLEEAK